MSCCVFKVHHLQNENVFVAFVSKHFVFLVEFLNVCLLLELLQMQQQVEPLAIVLPVERCLLQGPTKIPVT